MISYKHFPSDQELLPVYLDPKNEDHNEPVGVWIDLKYINLLWVFAKKNLRYDSHRAEDALHDTAERMCRWEVEERGKKFTTSPNLVLNALHNRVKDACHLITRRKSYKVEISNAPDELSYLTIDEYDLQELIKMERRYEQVKAYILRRWGNEEWQVVKLIFKYGRKARTHLTDHFGWNEDKTHRMITKINRHLKRLRLSDAHNPPSV